MDCTTWGVRAAAPGEAMEVAPGRAPDASRCMTCPVGAACIGGVAAQAGTRQLLAVLAGRRVLRAGEALQQAPHTLHAVRSGAVKSVLAGAVQPRAVHFPGELVTAGLAGCGQPLRLVALEDTELCLLRPGAAGPGGRAYLGRLWDMASRELVREHAQAGWLAGLPPERRITAFLASLTLRVRAPGARARPVRLYLSADDVGGLLRVLPATVGRVLAALTCRGLLEPGPDHIAIDRPELLQREARRD